MPRLYTVSCLTFSCRGRLHCGVRRSGESMKFRETKLKGVFEIDLEPAFDERGFFARSWCQKEFNARGLSPVLAQCNISFSERKGTLRGMHYQRPHPEAKL